MDIAVADIGGTHARFAIARLSPGGAIVLGEPLTLRTAEHATLASAWAVFAVRTGRALPRVGGIAIACPIAGDVLKMTNNPWVLRPASLAAELGLDHVLLINDFGAVGHAIARLSQDYLRHVAGPDAPLPGEGVIGIVGPGTGLGVAHVLRRGGRDEIIECEGGHVDFAPVDTIDDAILGRLRARYGRVSVERVVSGPGLANIYEALAMIEGQAIQPPADQALWSAALTGTDALAAAALARYCLCLGSVAGDIALASGASAMVIAGGVGLRLLDVLPGSGFSQRFCAKGRMEALLAAVPVKLVVHPQPGLFGAAAAVASLQARE